VTRINHKVKSLVSLTVLTLFALTTVTYAVSEIGRRYGGIVHTTAWVGTIEYNRIGETVWYTTIDVSYSTSWYARVKGFMILYTGELKLEWALYLGTAPTGAKQYSFNQTCNVQYGIVYDFVCEKVAGTPFDWGAYTNLPSQDYYIAVTAYSSP